MLPLLQSAVEKKLLRAIDVQLAGFLLPDKQPALLLLIAWLSAQSRSGHVCLLLTEFNQTKLFDGRESELARQIWQLAGEPQTEDWLGLLADCEAVSDGSRVSPLILQGRRLYLQRMWLDECFVADYFIHHSQGSAHNIAQLKSLLNQLFPHSQKQTDWQKIAVAVAATKRFAVISGGPGTGKTTTVAKLLATLVAQSPQPLRIVLAAPTGKAAARLTESLATAIRALPITVEPAEAITLHRLLGAQANSRYFRHNSQNPLHLDILIVDEASMVDLTMMARLIDALPPQARLILLGDRDQLASVEAGAVLGDLCRFAEYGYSSAQAQFLSELTGYVVNSSDQHADFLIRDNLCLLRHSYRFSEQSGIGQLAKAVNRGLAPQAIACFASFPDELCWLPMDYEAMITRSVEGYQYYLSTIKSLSIAETLQRLCHFQLLCALREGPFGVSGLNARIEQQLFKGQRHNDWYPGRPVIILRNDSQLGLYNGDVGIALPVGNKMMVHFRLSNGTTKAISPNRLPEHETAFALTVHKSQGSEFDHILFVLPDSYSPLLSRELLYTAITRARQKFTLFGPQNLLMKAITSPIERNSGLMARLNHDFDSK